MPIQLDPYNPEWPTIFASAKHELVGYLNQNTYEAIEHVGSTAIPSLRAKPIVDILIGVEDFEAMANIGSFIQQLNYQPWHSTPARATFQRRNHLAIPTHQIHVVIHHGPLWTDQIAFRDWLAAHESDRILYEKLKIASAAKYSDTQLYSDSKTVFVRQVLLKAK